MGLKFHPKYCSYFPLLVKALENVPGDVLELGAGLHSTFFLHWMCLDQNRMLYTYDNDPRFYEIANQCAADTHRVILVDDWDDAPIEREWGIAFVDQKPAIRRKDDIRRLADYAQCIIIHDSQGLQSHHYHYEEIRPLFRYKYSYMKARPHTMAVSNFIDVRKWG
ncbi:MAG: hypothetical protein KKC72_17810 [Alphaproteobacteria bacterium]|nr:hypothetical protein [Alphaproteobacteria bacterium]